jgi:hypothetical protein
MVFSKSTSEFVCIIFQIFSKKPLLNTFTSSMVGGIVVTLCMTPFDVVMTRLYNQGNVIVTCFIPGLQYLILCEIYQLSKFS